VHRECRSRQQHNNIALSGSIPLQPAARPENHNSLAKQYKRGACGYIHELDKMVEDVSPRSHYLEGLGPVPWSAHHWVVTRFWPLLTGWLEVVAEAIA
jgi:hypothetical protein